MSNDNIINTNSYMGKKDMVTKRADVIKASTSTYFWLSFLQATSNCNIIAESTIKYPFVEFLERNGYKNIQLETHHPCFNTRHLDLFCGNVSDDNIAILDEDALLYIEFKFVRPDTRNGKEQQRIFDDIMRLFQVKKEHPDTLCYFMITGEATMFESYFKSIKKPSNTKSTIEETTIDHLINIKPAQGVYSAWFSFNLNDRNKRIELFENPNFDMFKKEYSDHSLSSDDVVNTYLVNAFINQDSNVIQQSLALWEIL